VSHFAQDDAVGVGVGEETEELGESHEGGRKSDGDGERLVVAWIDFKDPCPSGFALPRGAMTQIRN
jgi:hypothetical protein